MPRLREEVDQVDLFEVVDLDELPQFAGQGGGVAGDVGDRRGLVEGARRIEYARPPRGGSTTTRSIPSGSSEAQLSTIRVSSSTFVSRLRRALRRPKRELAESDSTASTRR